MTTVLGIILTFVLGSAMAAEAQDVQEPSTQPPDVPPYLRDRGTGVATSMFGTYVRRGEWLFYPFFEYYRDRNFEYAPEDYGVPGDQNFRGRYRASEALFWLGYGLTENLALEIEAAAIRATFDKSAADGSLLPARLVESGLGDVESQLRWRWRRETDGHPELFSYGEVVFPHHRDKRLIGTSDVEIKVGTGVIRGFSWGTLTARGAVAYDRGSTSPFDVGEYAVEYLKRVSSSWRLYTGIEGTQDEVSLILEAQWHVTSNVFVRFNNSIGLTSKATDWGPEVGILFGLPTGRTRGSN